MTTPAPQVTAIDEPLRGDLLGQGWTDADVDGLVTDWPRLNSSSIRGLVGIALSLTEIVGDPTLARDWLRLMYVEFYPEFAPRETIRDFLLEASGFDPADTIGLVPSRVPAVAAYHRAAAGNGDLARISVAAGLSITEVESLAKSGDVNLDRLKALAALRNIPV